MTASGVIASGLCLGAVLAGGTGARALAVVGAATWIGGLERARTDAVAAGAVILLAALAAATTGVPFVAGTVALGTAAHAGRYGLALGRRIDDGARTLRVELVHLGGVAAVVVGAAATWAVAAGSGPTSQPIRVGLFSSGVVAAVLLLRSRGAQDRGGRR